MAVLRCTCRSELFNLKIEPQGAMLAGHSTAQSWGPSVQILHIVETAMLQLGGM